MRIILTRIGQTLFDIALQRYGDMSGIAFLIEDNPDLDLAVELEAATPINIRETVVNKTIAKEFEKFIPTSN